MSDQRSGYLARGNRKKNFRCSECDAVVRLIEKDPLPKGWVPIPGKVKTRYLCPDCNPRSAR